MTDDEVGERLARLRDATSAIAPPSGLAARLATKAMAPRPAMGLVIPFPRFAVAAAALVAAASIALAINVEHPVDDRLLQTTSEVDAP